MKNTKNEIINQSIILFGTHGYKHVSMHQIADAVGIKAGSIYNHFASKDELLDAVIDHYWGIFSSYHPTFPELHEMCESVAAREVLQTLCFIYKPEEAEKMLYLLRIQFSEQFRIQKVRKLVFDTFLDNRIHDMECLFQHMMELEKIPRQDPYALAQVWTSTMSIAAMRAAHSLEEIQTDLEKYSVTTNFLISLVCGDEE